VGAEEGGPGTGLHAVSRVRGRLCTVDSRKRGRDGGRRALVGGGQHRCTLLGAGEGQYGKEVMARGPWWL
jgi:hypothetical protein